MSVLNIAEMKEAATVCIDTNTPLFIHGAPGSGKTMAIEQLAKDLGYRHIDIRLSQKDAVDLCGIPYRNHETNRTSWAIPTMWPSDPNEKVLISFDEINHGTQQTLSAAFQIIQERKLGEFVFPKTARFIAAGNRKKDRTYANQMPSALRNRFTHITVAPEVDDWCDWAGKVGISPLIIGFIRFSPTSLIEIESNSESTEEQQRVKLALANNAFATPRAWAAVDRFIKYATDPTTGLLEFVKVQHLILGTIGDEVATKFNGYVRLAGQCPDIDKLIANPSTYIPTSEPAMQYAICAAVAEKTTADNGANVVKLLSYMPAEFQAASMKDIISRNAIFAMEPWFATWAQNNTGIF